MERQLRPSFAMPAKVIGLPGAEERAQTGTFFRGGPAPSAKNEPRAAHGYLDDGTLKPGERERAPCSDSPPLSRALYSVGFGPMHSSHQRPRFGIW